MSRNERVPPRLTPTGENSFEADDAGLSLGGEIHRQWEDGGEWNSFRDGKLASARLIFDTAAMAALMPGS